MSRLMDKTDISLGEVQKPGGFTGLSVNDWS
jgi:hypothetical protein